MQYITHADRIVRDASEDIGRNTDECIPFLVMVV